MKSYLGLFIVLNFTK